MSTGEQNTQVEFAQSIYNHIKDDIRDYRLLKAEFIELMDGILDTICIDYSMKVVNFINVFYSLQQAEKDEDGSTTLLKIDEAAMQSNIQAFIQEAERINRLYTLVDGMCKTQRSEVTGQEFRDGQLNVDVFRSASEVLSIPLGSMAVIGIDVGFLRTILSVGVQGAMDAHIHEAEGYKRQYDTNALFKLKATLGSYLKFISNAITESNNNLTLRAETQRQRDARMEQEISKIIINVFEPYEYSGSRPLYNNDIRSKLLLLQNLIEYIEVCEAIYTVMNKDTQTNEFGGLFSGEETDDAPQQDLGTLVARYNELKPITERICRVYKVHTISNIQMKKVTRYRIRGTVSDYISLRDTPNIADPVAFTDRLMSLGIINNKMLYVVYTVLRSIFRDSDYSHTHQVLDKKDKKNPAFIPLSKSIINILSATSLVPQKIPFGTFATNMLTSEMVNVDTFKERLNYTAMVNNQFEVQIERLLAVVLAGLRKVLMIDERARDIFSHERYSKRRMCEDLSSLLASPSNFRFINGKMTLFELEIIPKKVRKELCGDRPEIELTTSPDFFDLKSLYSMVKEPLVHYDHDSGVLYYIPMGRVLNHREDEEVSFSNFIYTYTRERKALERVQKNQIINIRTLVNIEYAPDSVFSWLLGQLAVIDQYTAVSNRPDRLFRVYSDELTYGKVYQRKLNKADTEALVEASTVLLSINDLADIRNDAMFNENIRLPGHTSVDKENRLHSLRRQMSLIANDTECDASKLFLTKGTLAGNDVYVFDKGTEKPVHYLGHMYCPQGSDPSLLRFQMSTKANPVLFSLNMFGITSKPNHMGKKGKAIGVNKLQNNAMYASRKVLMTILSRYVEKYNCYYSSPFALTYIFQKYKKQILTEYFRNLKLLMELIQRDNLSDLFTQIFSDSTLAPVVYSLLQSDAPLKGVTESIDITINGYVIDEVINMYLLLQKNKKMQMWYERAQTYDDSDGAYDSKFMYYQPVTTNRPSPGAIDDVIVDRLDFTEDNLNYDFITLEDLWGLPITSGEKTVINKSFQVFGVTRGVYKLSLDNLNPQKPAEETHKQALCNVLRALYSLYCAQEIKAPELDKSETIGGEQIGDSIDNNIVEMRDQKQMFLSTLTSAGAGDNITSIGFEDGDFQVQWFDKIDWVKYGVVAADGQPDRSWIDAYKAYITRLIGMTPLRDVHKESSYGKKFYGSRVNAEYIGYVFVKTLLDTKYSWVSGKNTLFFNRLHVTVGESVPAPDLFVEVAQAYYRAVALNLIADGDSPFAGELYLAARGIKKPTIAEIEDNFHNLFGRELPASFKVDVEVPAEAATAFNRTIQRLLASIDVLDNRVLYEFESSMARKMGEPLKLMEYLISFGKDEQDKWVTEGLQPANVNLSDEYVINEYAHNILVEDIPAKALIDLPFFGSENYCHQTFIRDCNLLNFLFKGGSTDLIKILLTRGQAEFEKQFRTVYERYNLNAFEQICNLIYGTDSFRFLSDDVGREIIGQFIGQLKDKVCWNVTHPVEYERVMCNVLDRLFKAHDNSSESLINRLLSELMTDRNIDLHSMKSLEEEIETIIKRDAFFRTLAKYSPKALVQAHSDAMTAILRTLNAQYKLSLPNMEDARAARRINNKLYENYLRTGNRSILDKIDIDSVGFETLTDSSWHKGYIVVPRYSVRGMVRNNPYLFTNYATYQQISGQAYSEGELEQDITGSNDGVSIKGKTKRPLPGYYVEFADADAPGLVGDVVSSKDILAGVDWYTSSIPGLSAEFFSESGYPVAVDINPYDLMDIWYVHKLLIKERISQYQEMLSEVCNPKNRNKGVILSWMIDNGAKWKILAEQGEIDFSKSAWGMKEYRNLARVLEVQASIIIPKVMSACGLKLAYNNLYDAIRLVKGDPDGGYTAGIFNYFTVQNILNGFLLIPGKDGIWSMDAGYMSLTEGTADSANVRAYMDHYEVFCEDYFLALFYLQSLTFGTSDTLLVQQYKDYWGNLPRQVVSEIMQQTIKVDRGLHAKVYANADADYRLPFKRVNVEEIGQ